jgi:alkylhydroperoxidase family enzyme
LAFTEKVTLTPWRITDGDWAGARDAGWSETELLEGSFTAALFGTITRLVDGLGLGSSVEHSRISQLPQSDSA